MSTKGLLSKRLNGIICNPPNLTINQVARKQVQAVIDSWESLSSPSIVTVNGKTESRLGLSPLTVVDDHKEMAALGYANLVSVQILYIPYRAPPLHAGPFSHRVMSKQNDKDIVVTIKASEGDSLLNAANEMINKCWGKDKDKDQDKLASAQFFFNESENSLIIRKQCSPKDKDEWNNCE